ncbi:hypothetical protein [Flavobacterium limi]|uniref:Lipoprotein n=1 Tax=Flavobacterium limi TaxID=2045105 RepID=A0ABQ1TVE7_9FLAO|nr:hypothetical protein [Flavobacterium limi]GGF03931.1 hypothetical protein GCM10011518_11380 [Flavobacterium limi]
METLFKSKIIFLLIIIGIVFSCKNNQDGYSDEIDTEKSTIDSAGATSDTINANNSNGDNSTGSNAPKPSPGTNSAASNAGEGSGPGESANDASTYTSSSGLQRDSVDSKRKSNKSK